MGDERGLMREKGGRGGDEREKGGGGRRMRKSKCFWEKKKER